MVQSEQLFHFKFLARNISKMRAHILSLMFVLSFGSLVLGSCNVSKQWNVGVFFYFKKMFVILQNRKESISNVCTIWFLETMNLKKTQAPKVMVSLFSLYFFEIDKTSVFVNICMWQKLEIWRKQFQTFRVSFKTTLYPTIPTIRQHLKNWNYNSSIIQRTR